jgi:transposase, IS5 family
MTGQSSFVDGLLAPGFGQNEKLERISGLIDWPRLERLVASARSGETGRPPYAAISMVKALLLQQMYDLSDPALEEALLERVSFRRFCGFALDGATPDETTLCRFRKPMRNTQGARP